MMCIREAKKSDANQLAVLVHSLAHYYLEEGRTSLPQWFSDTLEPSAFVERIANMGYLNLVFEENNAIKGYISVKNGSHLYHLFVAEQAQGKGIARQLWSKVLEKTPMNSHYSLRSSINAIPVYLKFGFHKIGNPGCKDGIGFQPMEYILKN